MAQAVLPSYVDIEERTVTAGNEVRSGKIITRITGLDAMARKRFIKVHASLKGLAHCGGTWYTTACHCLAIHSADVRCSAHADVLVLRPIPENTRSNITHDLQLLMTCHPQ